MASFNTRNRGLLLKAVSLSVSAVKLSLEIFFLFALFAVLKNARDKESLSSFSFFLSWQTSFNNETENPATQSKRPNTTN